jgi:hypothetical protein
MRPRRDSVRDEFDRMTLAETIVTFQIVFPSKEGSNPVWTIFLDDASLGSRRNNLSGYNFPSSSPAARP